MSNYLRFTAEDSGRAPSVAIFGDFSKIQHDMIEGYCVAHFDDFQAVGLMDSAGVNGHYYTYEDTGVVWGANTDTPNLNTDSNTHAMGVLECSGNDAANDEGNIQFSHGYPIRISNAANQDGKCMWEFRITVESITDNALAYFVGLGSGPVATAHLADTTGLLNTAQNFIGFKVNVDDGNKMDIVYQAAGQSIQTVLANAITLAVNTYVKPGMVYDPSETDDKKIKFFKDGVELNAYVNTTQIDAATFPEDVGLVPMILTKTPPAAEVPTKADWVAWAQYAAGVSN